MTPRFLEPAGQEFADATTFFEERSEGLGDKFVDEVEYCVAFLLEFPRSGRRLGEFRRFPLRKFPFALIYTVASDELVIIAVAHHRRRPGYWSDRLRD